MRHPVLVPFALGAVISAPRAASAFHVRSTADGHPVHWEADSVPVVADSSLATLGPGALAAAQRAFAAWGAVTGSSIPRVTLTEGAADAIGYRPGEENLSTLRYLPEGYAPAGSALAITVLTFDANGTILDADIILNGGKSRALGEGGDHEGNDAGEGGAYDLQSVLTHEAGHFLGLAHNNDDPDVTMFFATARGETKKRTLEADDMAGARSLYPAASSTDPVTISCAASGRTVGSGGWIGAALIGLGAAGRRRRALQRAFG